MRYWLENVICLCARCHIYGRGAWHKDPDAAMAWTRQHLGEEFVGRLREIARGLHGTDLDAVEIMLRQEIKRLTGGKSRG